MFIYEVNISVLPDVFESYRKWLLPHAAEVCKLGGFSSYKVFDVDVFGGKSLGKDIVVHYVAPTRETVDAYLRDHAQRLRQEAVDKFGASFNAHRRLLKGV